MTGNILGRRCIMLKLAGETDSGVREKIETITYSPGVEDTGDLEAATKTITATSKPGTADYSKALTLEKPSDVRLIIKRIGARLEVTRDSGTSNNLYCTVSVDSADGSANVLFNAVDVQAANLQATNVNSGTIFDLLSDGQEHTFYFFFWVDSGDSVISKVELWEGVGKGGSTSWQDALGIVHDGFLSFAFHDGKVGTGNVYNYCNWWGCSASCAEKTVHTWLIPDDFALYIGGSVATDLVYFNTLKCILRSEQ